MSTTTSIPNPSGSSNAPAPLILRPFANLGASFLGFTGACGGLAILACSAARASIAPRGECLPFRTAVSRNLDRLLTLAVPLTAMVHVALGSFLAMQAYFGATFVDGIGPVVGVGLIRNLAPIMTGFVLAGILSTLFCGELREHREAFLLDELDVIPDRDTPLETIRSRRRTEPARLVAARIVAAGIAGPLLSLWAAGVGIVVGWAVGLSILGVTTPGFFDLFIEMLWVRDITGLVAKGSLFAMAAALFGCFEGLRLAGDSTRGRVAAACRAATLSGIMILFLNSAWFLLFYHAGPAFGPTVLAPPHL